MSQRQGQSVTDGEAYQAGQNLTVYKGMAPEQMAEIMFAIGKQLSVYFAEAEKKAEDRMRELRDAIVAEFVDPETKANSEAFTEPDFQAVVQKAHQSYARSGSEELRSELVELIKERSAQPTGSRIAHTLNRAIEVAGTLTAEDNSALGIIFSLKSVSLETSDSQFLFNYVSKAIESCLSDLPRNNNAYSYLESIGCVAMRPLTSENELWEFLRAKFGSLMNTGFTHDDLRRIAADNEVYEKCISLCTWVSGKMFGRVRFKAVNSDELRSKLSDASLDANVVQQMVTIFASGLPTVGQVREQFCAHVPGMIEFERVWKATNLPHAELTLLGMALGHSVMASRTSFKESLDIWIS